MRSSTTCMCCIFPILAVSLCCCGDDGIDPDRPFGKTAVVVAVNPVVNADNTSAVPACHDAGRVEGIEVDADPGDADTTDADGFAVLDELDEGAVEVVLDDGPSLPLTIVQEGDVYDLAVAFDGETARAFANFPIRYGVGGEIQVFDTKADPQQVADALSTNGNIVFFENGTYQGDLLITGDDVIFFGEGFTEHEVVIDGAVEVRGTGVRIRGFTVTGDIAVHGNNFGMAHSVVQGDTAINGESVGFLANHFCGRVTVPSSNATLLHNRGLAPMDPPDADLCR